MMKQGISKEALTEFLIEKTKSNRKDIMRFLGYSNRPAPGVIVRKIEEELESFGVYLKPEYYYRVFEEDGIRYADILYTIGSDIEEPIKRYTDSAEAMRGMILDKIAVVSLDELKDLIYEEIREVYGFFVSRELYPGSTHFPLEKQTEIYESVAAESRVISINSYHQLFPLKTVALRSALSSVPVHFNRCETCSNPCEKAIK